MSKTGVLEAVGDTPLVELASLPDADGARVFVKLEGANPTGSMKDRMALAMVEGAREEGVLEPGGPVVEYTGGSTGSSLALVCSVLGHPLSIVTADCFAQEKIRTMRALGATVEVRTTPGGQVYPGLLDELVDRATEIATETGAYHTDQFRNQHQLDGYAPLGEELLADGPEPDAFVVAVGTAGCAMGVSRALHEHGVDPRVSLVEPTESPYLSEGQAGDHGVEGIALGVRPPLLDDDLYDDVMTIPEGEAREVARTLAREEGVFGGVSTSINVAAALRVASERSPDETVVTVACDTGLKYLAGDLYR